MDITATPAADTGLPMGAIVEIVDNLDDLSHLLDALNLAIVGTDFSDPTDKTALITLAASCKDALLNVLFDIKATLSAKVSA